MARLLILRGEILDREVELKNKTVRLGRGQQNDVMLEDEGKSVSRNHAEIRYEGGRYVLVDLESQNGVWVSGAKVPYVVLEPNVVASVGPYRLMVEAGGGATAYRPDSGTFAGPAIDSGQYEAETGARRDPRQEPRLGPRQGRPVPPQGNWFSRQPMWLLGGAGAAAIGVTAFAVTSVMRAPSSPGDSPNAIIAERLMTAADLIEAGACATALSDHIEPVLVNDPTNAQALALRDKAAACATVDPASPPPSSGGMPPEAITANLQEARKLIDAGRCDIALQDHVSPVLASDPANAEALALKIRAESGCRSTQPPPSEPAAVLAKRILPEKGGLEPLQGEQQKDYDSRVRVMRARYDEAQAALSSGLFQRADLLFSGIIRDAGDRYLDAGRLLLQAKNSLRDLALKIYQGAVELERHDEWDKAILEFRRAQETDPSTISVEPDLKRVNDRKAGAGQVKCDEGNANFLLKRNQVALLAYEAALKLLPADHKCFAVAKERVALLKK